MLRDSPRFGVFNKDQTRGIVTSRKDMLFVDITNDKEVDIDEKEDISDVMNVVADDHYFYVLANKKKKIIGYYLFLIDIDKAHDD